MRPIDADEVHKRIDYKLPVFVGTLNGILCCGAHDFIDSIPTIEAEPVRHEKWEDLGGNCGMRCTGCKRRIRYKYGMRNSAEKGYYEYCPGCGARMDGGAAP